MKSIELFVGAGGLGMGVHQAGFRQIFSVENNKKCCDTIQLNQSSGLDLLEGWNVVNESVVGLDFREYEGKVDLISGGPPCQPFSLGGKHRADDDSRNMFPHAIRAIREVKPRAFIFENVKGLTRSTFGRIILSISSYSLLFLK